MGSIEAVPYLVNAIRTNTWMNPWVYTYVKLKEGIDPKAFEAKLDNLVETYGGGDLTQRLGEDYAQSGHKFAYFLQPIETIHLHSKQDIEIEPNSDIMYVYLLSVIALIILIISSINYINLSVARSPVRAKEVGIRKVVGVNRLALIAQFLTESTMICLISAAIAIGIVASSDSIFQFSVKHSAFSRSPTRSDGDYDFCRIHSSGRDSFGILSSNGYRCHSAFTHS